LHISSLPSCLAAVAVVKGLSVLQSLLLFLLRIVVLEKVSAENIFSFCSAKYFVVGSSWEEGGYGSRVQMAPSHARRVSSQLIAFE
jgi:hypothetical protein